MKWLRVHTKLLKNMNEKNGLKLVHIFLTKFKNEVEEQIWIENKNVRPETTEIFKNRWNKGQKPKQIMPSKSSPSVFNDSSTHQKLKEFTTLNYKYIFICLICQRNSLTDHYYFNF